MGSKSPIGGYYPTSQNTSSSSSGTSSGTTTREPDPYAAQLYQQALQNAQGIASQPYQPYQGQQIAGFTPSQIAAQTGFQNAVGMSTPYYTAAQDLYNQGLQYQTNPELATAANYYYQGVQNAVNPNQQQSQGIYEQSLQNLNNQQLGSAIGLYNQGATAANNPLLGQAQGLYNQSTQNLNNPQLGAALGLYSQGAAAANNPYLSQAQGMFGQAIQNIPNQQLTPALNLYSQSVQSAVNPNQPLAQNLYNQSFQNLTNPQMSAAEAAYRQSTLGATNALLPTSQWMYNQSLANLNNPQLTPALNLYSQSVQGAANPLLSASQGLYGQSLQNLNNPLSSPALNYYTQGALSSSNPLMATSQDIYKQSLQDLQNPMLSTAQGMYGQAINYADPSRFGQEALSRYMNPFQQDVVNATMNQLTQTERQALGQNTQNAVLRGSYGGSGEFLGRAQVAQQQALANAQALSQLNAQNYAQAQQQYNQQQAQAIQAQQQAAQGLGALGGQQQAQALQAQQQVAQGLGALGAQNAALQAQGYQTAAQGYSALGAQQQQAAIQAQQQAAQQLGALGGQQAALQAQTLQGAAQGVGTLGQQQLAQQIQAQQNAAQALGALGAQNAALQTQAYQGQAQGLGQLGAQQQAQALQAYQNAAQQLGQLGYQGAALQSQAAQGAAQGVGTLGQQQAAQGVQAYLSAGQQLGALGGQQAALQSQALQNAAQGYGTLGQQQLATQIQALQNAAQGVGAVGGQQAALQSQALQNAAQGVGSLGAQQQQAIVQGMQNAAQQIGQLGYQGAALQSQAQQNAAQGLGALGAQQQAQDIANIQNLAAGMGNLGAQQQTSYLQSLQALAASGAQQQQLQQAQLQNAYQQWMQAQAYPYQQLSYLSGLSSGLGPLLGSIASTSGTSSQSGTGASLGMQPYANQSGAGGIAGAVTSGLGLLGGLIGLKDGGRVTGRRHYAFGGTDDGSEQSEDQSFGSLMGQEQPYASVSVSGPMGTAKKDIGSLASQRPYSGGNQDYITNSLKLSKVIPSASQVASEELVQEISHALGSIPELASVPSPAKDITSSFFGSPDTSGTGIGELGSGTRSSSGSRKGLFSSLFGGSSNSSNSSGESSYQGASTDSGGFDLGSLLSGNGESLFASGGRVHRADGGNTQSFTPEQANQYVQNLYQTTFGRAPDAGGLSYWANQLQSGAATPNQITSSFAASPEAQTTLGNLYQTALHRAPDAGGLQYWTQRLAEGTPLSDIQSSIQNTDEARAALGAATSPASGGQNPSTTPAPAAPTPLSGPEAASFVQDLYRNTLGRTAEQSGFDYWTKQLQTGAMSPSEVRQRFAASPEEQTNLGNLYQTNVNRAPEQSGLDYWTNLLAQGEPLSNVSARIKETPETQSVTGLKNTASGLYQDVLGAAPGNADLGSLAQQLAAGSTTDQLRQQLAQSAPAQSALSTAYEQSLGRAPSLQNLAGLTQQLGSGEKNLAQISDYLTNGPEGQQYNLTHPGIQGSAAVLSPKTIGGVMSRPDSQAFNQTLNPSGKVGLGFGDLMAQARAASPGPQLSPVQQGMPAMPPASYYTSRMPTYPTSAPLVPYPKPAATTSGDGKTAAQLPANYMGLSQTAAALAPDAFVNTLYKQYTGAEPTSDQLSSALGSLSGGTTYQQLESTLANTPAAQNQSFVTQLYNRILGRAPDAGGLQYWTGQLASGMPASEVERTFARGPEQQASSVVQGYYPTIGSTTVNPDTGLFNLNYVAPYKSQPVPYVSGYKDGGRVERSTGGRLSFGEIAQAALQAGATPHEAAVLTSIAMPESARNAYAHNPNARTGDNSYGLWQINMLGSMGPERRRQFGLSRNEDLYDPVTNARAALQLLRGRGGLKNWTTYTSGKNRPYYSAAVDAVNSVVKDPKAMVTRIEAPPPQFRPAEPKRTSVMYGPPPARPAQEVAAAPETRPGRERSLSLAELLDSFARQENEGSNMGEGFAPPPAAEIMPITPLKPVIPSLAAFGDLESSPRNRYLDQLIESETARSRAS